MLSTGEIIQVQVSQLPSVHSSLLSLLAQECPDASQLNNLFANYIEAECIQCGIRISGEEMGQISSSRIDGQARGVKLMRLKHNSCARGSCTSCSYRINLLPHPGVDWEKIKGQIVDRPAVPLGKSEPVITRPVWSFERKAMAYVSATVAVLVLFFLVRHWLTGARIPLLQKAHRYQIDPATTGR